MTRRARIWSYGSALGVSIIGGIVVAISSGLGWKAVGWSLFGLGLGAIVLLVFLEIGLSEDRARKEEEKTRSR